MSFYGSGAVIADILVKNQQIPAAPDFGDTFDASFVDALNE
jgi:NitT/TauT family transport system substrate-binding protein